MPVRSRSRIPAAATSGPAPMKSRGPWRSASAPKRRESANMTIVTGQRRQAALERAVAGDLLQEDDEEEEQDREARVHRERLDVADGEVAAREQLELEHRLLRAALVDEEAGERERCRRSAARRSPGCPSRSAAARSARTRARRGRATHRRRAEDVDAPPARTRAVAAPRRGSGRASTRTSGTLSAKIQRHETWSTIQPPASGPTIAAIPPQAVHDPMAAPRSLGANAPTMIASELGVSSAPAAPCSARAAISVSIVGASGAREREDAERRDADREDAPLAVDVPERAADEDQRREREQVGVRRPTAAPERPPPRSRSIAGSATLTIDAVDRRDAGAEDRGEERQPLPAGHLGRSSARGRAGRRT